MPGTIQSITVQPKPSQYLRIWLLSIHLLALLTTLFAPIDLWQKLMLLAALALYSYFTLGKERGKSGSQILRATITPYGRARIVMRDGRKQTARIRQDSLVTPWLVIVRFDLTRGLLPVSLLLLPDSVSEEQLRKLRVLLRFTQLEAVSDYP
jgi:hypothetical protein